MSRSGTIRGWVVGDAQANRVVPPTGFSARLTLFAAGALAFLAVFVLALSLAASRIADGWSEELARSATLRISAPLGQRAAQTELALRILRQTPSVAEVRTLSVEEQTGLLTPWFGASLSLEDLPVPQMIEVIEDGTGYDAAGLHLRLTAELPGAVLDDHTRWRRPLVEAANGLCRLGLISVVLIGGAMAAMITLTAQAALAANSQVIEVLRLVGARDSYIAQAFVRRFTLRALTGGAVGAAVTLIATALAARRTLRGLA